MFIERVAIDVNDRVKLIAAEEDLDTALQTTEAESGTSWTFCASDSIISWSMYQSPGPGTHPVIAVSRHVMVLLEAEVTGLRNAHGLRAAVNDIAGENRVFTVLNRANRPGGLPTPTIVKGLGAQPDIVIPDLGKGMTQAVNLGVPALERVHWAAAILSPLVQEIAGISAGKRVGSGGCSPMKTFGKREIDRGGTAPREPTIHQGARKQSSFIRLLCRRPSIIRLLRRHKSFSLRFRPCCANASLPRSIAAAAVLPRDVFDARSKRSSTASPTRNGSNYQGVSRLGLAAELANDMTDYGPLRPLLADETISDIMVNAPNNIYVERGGKTGTCRRAVP